MERGVLDQRLLLVHNVEIVYSAYLRWLQFVAHEQVGEVVGIDGSDSTCGCQLIIGDNVPSTLVIVAITRRIRIALVILSRWHKQEADRGPTVGFTGWVMLLVIGRG
jgi:hypothetical protein